ncbi:hypothetical protein RhiTH_010224 [Rhizoctonia solani]
MVESNQHQRPSPFKQGDWVYVSTKNMRIPMGKPHKLLAQWIGPVVIDGVVKEGATYHVELPEDLRRRRIKAIFHALLLKPHIPYKDRRFPGRNYKQIALLEANDNKWAVEKIVGHCGKGSNAVFEIVWQTGDRTWETYRVVRHLEALKQYFKAIGVKQARDLPWAEGGDTPYDELSDSGSETLEGASIRVLKEGDPEYKHLTTPLLHIKLTELLSLYKGCPTADAGDVVGTTTNNKTNHQRINRTTLKPSKPVTPKYSKEANKGAWGHAQDISTITRTLVEGSWTCTKEGALDKEELNLAVAGQLPGEGASPPSRTEVNNKEESEALANPALTTLPDPIERVPLNPPLRPALDLNQRGAIGLQINDLLSKVTRAIRTVENLISVTKTLNERVKRTHQRVVDREWDIMEDMSRIVLRALRIGDKPRIGNASYPQELLRQAYPGEQGNFETLRAVAAPKSSVGEDKANSNNRSDGGPKPSATEQDNPDVRDATNHVAKWTTLGPDVKMRDAGNRLKTLKPEQPCISPRKLELKQLLVRRRND